MGYWEDTKINKNRFFLKGTEALVREHCTQEFTFVADKRFDKEIKKRQLKSERINDREEFLLREVSKEEIKKLRKSEVPGFILKKGEKYFYTEIYYNTRLLTKNLLSEHKCGKCSRLLAADDCDGGCAKVRERSYGIERYSWIISGYESFNTIDYGAFIVEKCTHYVQMKDLTGNTI